MSDLEVKIFNNLGVCPTGSGIFIIPGATGPQGPTGATGPAAPSNVGLIRINKYGPGDGTITLHSSTTAFIVKCHAPGAGSGGVDGQGSDTFAASDGAGAGGYFSHIFYKSTSTTFDYIVGSKGLGGSSGNNGGTNGSSNSSVTYDGYTIGVSYGRSSPGVTGSSKSPGYVSLYGGPGGSVVTGAPNLLSVPGKFGESAVILATNSSGRSGKGGDSFSGFGGYETGISPGGGYSSGTNALGYGAGAGGAISVGQSMDRPGGDGGDGYLIVEEYCGLFAP